MSTFPLIDTSDYFAHIYEPLLCSVPPLAPTRMVLDPFGRWMLTFDRDGAEPGVCEYVRLSMDISYVSAGVCSIWSILPS